MRADGAVGFTREGPSREHNVAGGRGHDGHRYGILGDGFDARYRPDQTDRLVGGDLP